MKYLRIGIVVLAVVAVFLVRASVIKIAPDEIGVRTVNLSGGTGIVNQDYGPGYHRDLWPFDTWHVFPSTVQRIRFAAGATGLDGRPMGELQLASAGGDRVAMTAEVVYRIADGEAHKVLQDSGDERRFEDVVRTISQDSVRVVFGRLRTEGFYNSPAGREQARHEAATLLRDQLQPRGIELVDLLLQSIEFDPNYEGLIKQKKIADQQVELQKAKAKAAEETGKVAKIKASTVVRVQKVERETEAKVTQLDTETTLQAAALAGEAGRYATQKNADGSLYESQKKAEGEKAIKLAQAEGTQQLNLALAGEGGRNLIALQAAKALNLAEVTFPSLGYDWFNPSDMALRLGGGMEAGVPATAPADSH
jgi:hypothetical protein